MARSSAVAPSSSVGGGSFSGGGGSRALMDSVRRAASSAVSSATGTSVGGLFSSSITPGASGKVQQWNGVVTLVLIDGRNLIACDDDGFSDPYVKFRLGSEKYKSKVSVTCHFIRSSSSSSSWSDLIGDVMSSAATVG